ncbi:MAG: Holliday junction branch migration DNA helicase RuvB, partial [Chloroflexi bacterium]|nr:Holliday junction branch migration DNA helicase RuvB [Chloroflexota bacterium]
MDRVVAPTPASSDEERLLTTLRPRSLDEFIGQDLQRKRLAIALEAARQRREPLDHLLLSGPPGLGKTTLAHIVAFEMGGSLVTTSGPAIEKSLDLMGMLTGLEADDVFFIDEIHRLPRVIEEYLYPAMEDFKVDFVLDKGPYARAYPLAVQPFTLVGATTRKGLLSSPLRERFGLNFELDFYTVADLTQIVRRSAGLLNVRMDADAAQEIARRSRGTPRIANRLLRRVRDYAQVHHAELIEVGLVNDALTLEGVDAVGLDDLDRRYLTTLISHYEGGPAGVSALAANMQQEVDTLEEVVEPYLLHEGFIQRTPAGRRATPKAY